MGVVMQQCSAKNKEASSRAAQPSGSSEGAHWCRGQHWQAHTALRRSALKTYPSPLGTDSRCLLRFHFKMRKARHLEQRQGSCEYKEGEEDE